MSHQQTRPCPGEWHPGGHPGGGAGGSRLGAYPVQCPQASPCTYVPGLSRGQGSPGRGPGCGVSRNSACGAGAGLGPASVLLPRGLCPGCSLCPEALDSGVPAGSPSPRPFHPRLPPPGLRPCTRGLPSTAVSPARLRPGKRVLCCLSVPDPCVLPGLPRARRRPRPRGWGLVQPAWIQLTRAQSWGDSATPGVARAGQRPWRWGGPSTQGGACPVCREAGSGGAGSLPGSPTQRVGTTSGAMAHSQMPMRTEKSWGGAWPPWATLSCGRGVHSGRQCGAPTPTAGLPSLSLALTPELWPTHCLPFPPALSVPDPRLTCPGPHPRLALDPPWALPAFPTPPRPTPLSWQGPGTGVLGWPQVLWEGRAAGKRGSGECRWRAGPGGRWDPVSELSVFAWTSPAGRGLSRAQLPRGKEAGGRGSGAGEAWGAQHFPQRGRGDGAQEGREGVLPRGEAGGH